MPRTTSSNILSKLVGIKIKKARLDSKITQKELARRMNTSPPYIAALEAGRYNLTLGQLDAIANALEIAVDIEFFVPDVEWHDIKIPPPSSSI